MLTHTCPVRSPLQIASETAVPQPLPIRALVETAQKKRLLTRVTAERLGEFAAGKGVTTRDELDRWLATGEGLSPELAKKLRALLPMPAVKPFGPYLPLTHLADGGMGSVWLSAHQDQLAAADGRLVVVKTIKSELPIDLASSQGNEFVKRFERESKITRELDHPNVVRCLDSGVADGRTMFMVLEYVDSGDLRDLVERRGGLSEALALAVLHQVTDGLCEAHRLKLVHRDIKPPNIFVASDGRAKLADFGIARSTDANRTALTMQGAIVGSPLYMSPEQVLTDPTLDIRSDIYAMGAVLYFCLAAEPPYNAGKLQEILHLHCTAPVPDVRRKRPQVSEAAQAIIAKAMAKDRNQRFREPAELRDAIVAALDHMGALPGQAVDESTAQGDLSGKGGAFHPATRADMRTLTANLRGDEDAMEPATPAPGADQPTIASDLSGQATIASDLSGQATIATDLSGGAGQAGVTVATAPAHAELPTMAADLNAMQTMTALLLSQEPDQAAPVANPAQEPGTHATVAASGTIARILSGAEPAMVPIASGRLEGDLASAIAGDWVSLLPPQPVADGPGVVLLARTRLTLGKLREAPCDLCVRNYPISVHKESCQRISRGHAALRYDAVQNLCLVEDLNAPNGTMVDGLVLPSGKTATLALGAENILVLAGVVSLWLRVVPRRGPKVASLDGAPAGPAAACGIDSDHQLDAVAITRPENRPELAYAQVLRRIAIGGPGADLPLAGARTRTVVELAVFQGRWIWRVPAAAGQAEPAWRPLAEGTELDCGGRALRATAGQYTHF
jgi:serine/threonine protein kinase